MENGSRKKKSPAMVPDNEKGAAPVAMRGSKRDEAEQ